MEVENHLKRQETHIGETPISTEPWLWEEWVTPYNEKAEAPPLDA